jgi:hypothetical protein
MLRVFLFAGQHDTFFSERRDCYPIFIPSKGRADKAFLNLLTPDCLGLPSQFKDLPLVIVVLERNDVQNYRSRWPQLLILTLPGCDHHRTGVGFSRATVQRICEGATVHLPWSPPKFIQFKGGFLLDDLVSGFAELRPLDMQAWKKRMSSTIGKGALRLISCGFIIHSVFGLLSYTCKSMPLPTRSLLQASFVIVVLRLRHLKNSLTRLVAFTKFSS